MLYGHLLVMVEAKIGILDEEWWIKLVKKFTDNKINVYHFGYFKEPKLSTDNRTLSQFN